MTNEDVQSEIDKEPFVPLRIHLVSGKTIDVTIPGVAWMLRHAVMIARHPRNVPQSLEDAYDIVALRNIERLERPPTPTE